MVELNRFRRMGKVRNQNRKTQVCVNLAKIKIIIIEPERTVMNGNNYIGQLKIDVVQT